MRLHAGVDLAKVLIDKKWKRIIACWERMLMGFYPSPYFVTKDILVIEGVIRESRLDKHNIFQWDHVVLNLPGMYPYDSSISWIFKVKVDGSIAVDFYFYIDGCRPTTDTDCDCCNASRKKLVVL